MPDEIKPIYNFKNLFNKAPIVLSGVVMSVVNLLVVFGAIHWTPTQVSSVNGVLLLVLGLFINSQTVPTQVAEQAAQQRAAEKEQQIQTFLRLTEEGQALAEPPAAVVTKDAAAVPDAKKAAHRAPHPK